ncbi:amino acid ABC transporter ATP-binding protein [Rickettsiaceae bacterium]|nr:amino acid ABC transporter ATP-binding protein [Rickettsiaceae bacterium]
MIVLENITKKFGSIVALKDINLVFDKKEVVVLTGSSGSGKSTLVRCINNLETPTSGIIKINGQKLSKANRRKLCSKIGMVFQQFNLFPHMSVMDNLTYSPINVLGKNKIDAENDAKKLLKNFGMLEKANDMPKGLSGGQKQRVAICRSLMMNPEIIFLDEPTSALDIETIQDIIKIIGELKSKVTMVIITHHIKFAKIVADRIIFMDKGLVLADQSAKEFFKKPKSHRARLFLENIKSLI